MTENKLIGIFDSGYGGLTVFRSIHRQLPDYDYIYLGDTARAPYGNRSFQTIYQYTWQCVQWLFNQGCRLIILACNTASAKALRNIQQIGLKTGDPALRVLGVIRPTAEVIGKFTATGEIGVLGTKGTVQSESYLIEISRFFPDVKVYQQACPLWVPVIENGEYDNPGADYFVKKYLDEILAQSSGIDTLLLACTHYPLLNEKIRAYLPQSVGIVSQGDIVAKSLVDYLGRHKEMEAALSKNKTQKFFTTSDDTADFDRYAALFFAAPVKSGFAEINC
jgi:glutamate racemase